jgi:hypothetical protein
MKDEKPIPMPPYRDPATGLTDEEAGIVGDGTEPWIPDECPFCGRDTCEDPCCDGTGPE